MFDDLKNRLTGCCYTIFTPFDDGLAIDYDCLKNYINTLHSQGASLFYAMAYNSRYSQLTQNEILELNEFCIKTVKDLSRNNIVIVGDPIHCSTETSIEFAIHAKEAGGDLISLIMREKYFSDEQVLGHFAMVGDRSDFPILVHEMPFLSGYNGKQMQWPESLLSGLRNIPHVIALKEDAHEFEITKQALELEPRIRVIIAGKKSILRQYMNLGCKAYLNGISMIDASIGKYFWEAFEKKDIKTVDFICDQVEAPFFDKFVSQYGWHRSNKALLEAVNMMSRRDRMPLKHLSDSEIEPLEGILEDIQTAWAEYRSSNN